MPVCVVDWSLLMLVSGPTMEILFVIFVIILWGGLMIWELSSNVRIAKFLMKLLRRFGL